MTLTHDMKVTG